MIKLLEKTVSKSSTGFETRNTTEGREIIAEQGGVGRSEFYKAAAAGQTEGQWVCPPPLLLPFPKLIISKNA